MPQSLARLCVHLVFSTKIREAIIHDQIRPELHSYMVTVVKNMRCPVLAINSVPDHVHILMDLGRTVAVSDVVEEVKKSSSKWIKTRGDEFAAFAWQAGYGAFAVSESNVPAVKRYIANQADRHKRMSFQDEYRAFLTKHGIAFEEKYVWD